jgi:lysophospholipase L1-like esterase
LAILNAQKIFDGCKERCFVLKLNKSAGGVFMSVLETVLVSALAFIVLLLVIYLLILRGLKVNKAQTYQLLNEHSQRGKIVFFGDSLTDFYPIQEFFDEPTIYNRGVAGDTTDDLLARINNVTDISPSKVFLLIGSNDIGLGKTPSYVAQNTKNIMQKIKDACPDCAIYLQSQYPVRRVKNFFSFFACLFRSHKKFQKLDELNKITAEEFGCAFIEMYSSLCDEKNRLKKEFTFDGLHMTALAYCNISSVLDKYINE